MKVNNLVDRVKKRLKLPGLIYGELEDDALTGGVRVLDVFLVPLDVAVTVDVGNDTGLLVAAGTGATILHTIQMIMLTLK